MKEKEPDGMMSVSEGGSSEDERRIAAQQLEAGREVFTPFINAFAEKAASFGHEDENLSIPAPVISPSVDSLFSSRGYQEVKKRDASPIDVFRLAFHSDDEVRSAIKEGVTPFSSTGNPEKMMANRAVLTTEKYRSAIYESSLGVVFNSLSIQGKKDFMRLIGSIAYNSRSFRSDKLDELSNYVTEHYQFAQKLPIQANDSFLWGKQVGVSEINSTLDAVVVPIGYYGKELAGKLYYTTQRMLHIAGLMSEESEELASRHEEYLRTTMRGMSPRNPMPQVPLRILREGIQSLTSAVVLASSEEFEGFTNYIDLVKAIIIQGVPARMARSMPGGVMNPLVNISKYIPGLIQNQHGQFSFNQNMEKTIFIPWKKRYQHSQAEEYAQQRKILPAAGRGCPVAFKGGSFKESGIDCLSATFLHLFES